MFAGTGVSTHFKRVTFLFYAAKFGVKLHMPTTCYVEKKVEKQAWLESQHTMLKPESGSRSGAVLVGTSAELSSVSVKDVREIEPRIVPQPFLVDQGTPCTARTSLNKNAAKNVHCVQNKTETTGVAYEETRRAFEVHAPMLGIGECVTALWATTPDNPRSDGQYMCETKRDLGYWSICVQSQAREYGGWVYRLRGYWGDIRGISCDSDVVDSWFMGLMNGFKLDPFAFGPEYFITMDDKQRQEEADIIGIPTFAELGRREPLTNHVAPDWKTDHLFYFEFLFGDGSWPPGEDFQQASSIDFNGMLPREKELVMFIDRAFPTLPENARKLEFVDINPKMERVLSGHINMADGTLKGSPWALNNPGTQVGSGKIATGHGQHAA